MLIESLIGGTDEELPVVAKDTHVEELFRLLMSRHHVWVVDNMDNMKLVGLITEKDMLEILSPKRISPYSIGGMNMRSMLFGKTTKAEDVATTQLVVTEPHDTVEDVLHKMKDYRLRRLPVVKDGVLVGEITLKKLMQEFIKVLKWYRFKQDVNK